MEESELRVQMSTHLHSPADAAASHMLQMPDVYQRWASEHDRLMRGISTHVSIGRAKKKHGWMDAWFTLVRDDPQLPS